MPSLHVVERTAYPQDIVGRSYQHFFPENIPAPLAGAQSPKRAGRFFKNEAVREDALRNEAELGDAIFRFVFLRY